MNTQRHDDAGREEWPSGVRPDHTISAPRGSATAGRLTFTRGVSLLSIAGEPGLPDLFHARCEGPAPLVHASDGDVTFQYERLPLRAWARYALLWGRHATTLALNTGLPWQITMKGGASRVSADLRALHMRGLAVHGGVSDVQLDLPTAHGVVRILVAGGASRFTVRCPAQGAVALRVDGGATRLTFGTQRYGAIGGGVQLEAPGAANDRYEIEIAGGASDLLVDIRA
jgi:hypothetical protein